MTSSRCRAYLRDLQRFGIKLGLDTMTALLAALGSPQNAFPSIHVAGTNGKGSVSAMVAEILKVHGLKAGLYTSPHLVRIEERIRIGGRMISSRDFCRLTGIVRDRIDALLAAKTLEVHPTFFEVLTTIALLAFREAGVDVAVLEVGMGGRFDATNVVTPVVSVITSISRDHQEHLGATISKIAFEKAGIIKPGVPVICGAESGPAVRVIKAQAEVKGAPLTMVFDRAHRLCSARERDRFHFRYGFGGEAFEFTPGLRGAHQGRNAAVAIAAVTVLGRVWRPLHKAGILRGIETAVWEGRLEIAGRNPTVILDGAHNEAGAAALAGYIRDFSPKPPVLVFLMMRDKAIRRVISLLFPLAGTVVLTTIPYARAAAPDEILRLAPAFKKRILVEPSLKKALRLARIKAGRWGTVIVTGSLFLVGAAKKLGLGKKNAGG
jgi:dihydrofolate synthase/folylpolyglutamate synthase